MTVLFAALALVAMGDARAAEPSFPPGSRTGLVPPQGFVVEDRVRGFVDRDRQALMILVDLPSNAFGEVAKALTAAALKSQGVVQEKRENLSLPVGKALLVTGRQEAQGVKFRKWILVASSPEVTALVTVQVPETAKAIYSDGVIRTALQSLAVRAKVPAEEWLSLLPFKINDLAGLRPVRVAGSSVVFTDGPRDDLGASEQSHMIVTVGPGGPANPDQRETFARNLFGGLPGFKDMRVTGSEMLRLPGQHVHELRVEGKRAESNSDVRIVQWTRFGPAAYVQIVGIAPAADWESAFPRFRGLRDGISPR